LVKSGKSSSSSRWLEGYFIRLRNWKQLYTGSKSHKFTKIFPSFNNVVITGSYIDKIYIPIKVYQQEQLRMAKNLMKPHRKSVFFLN